MIVDRKCSVAIANLTRLHVEPVSIEPPTKVGSNFCQQPSENHGNGFPSRWVLHLTR